MTENEPESLADIVCGLGYLGASRQDARKVVALEYNDMVKVRYMCRDIRDEMKEIVELLEGSTDSNLDFDHLMAFNRYWKYEAWE